MEPEIVTADSSGPNYTPVVFDKPQFDAYVQGFSAEGQDSSKIIAEMLAEEVLGTGSYDGLVSGQSTLFDTFEPLRGKPSAQRALTNNQIISLLAVDTEGNPIEAGTFLEGFKREVAPSATALGGFMTGVKAGSKVPIVHPIAKGAFVLGSGIVGSLAGYKGGELLTDELIGEESPMLPGQTSAYESGKTAAGALAWLPFPFMISKNVGVGTAEFIKNLADRGLSPSRSTRLLQGAQNLLSKTGTAARGAPTPFLVGEAIAATGQTLGAGFSEEYFQGDPLARIFFETSGGVGATLAGSPFIPLVTNFKKMLPVFKNVKNTYEQGGASAVLSPLKNARQKKAVERIVDILEAEGENVEEVIARLAGDDLGELLIGEDGKPIALTAGAKGGSPALLAIEASLEQLGSGLSAERTAGSKASIKALRNVILAMAQTGDQDALQTAADLAEGVFSAQLNERMAFATDNVLKAFDTVSGDGSSNIQLSEKLFDVITNQLGQARGKEKALWSAVPDIDLTSFTDAAGEATNTPSFITAWKRLRGVSPELQTKLAKDMPLLEAFVTRKTDELGLGGAAPVSGELRTAQRRASDAVNKLAGTSYENRVSSIIDTMTSEGASQADILARLRQEASSARGRMSTPRTRQLANALDQTADLMVLQGKQSTDDGAGAVTEPLTTKELTELRGIALNYARQFASGENPDYNSARIANEMASAMLDDLGGASLGSSAAENYRFQYDTARAYSRSLNNTFTRAFAGEATKTKGSGAASMGPELLARRILQGGNDPTYLRLEQINDIGMFAVEEGLADAETTIGTLRGVTEQILRNARSEAFDPNTGTVNPDALAKWISKNEDVLSQFPSLKYDLQDAATANVLLKETSIINKKNQAEELAQLSFYDLMNPVSSDTGRRIYGTESPTTAVTRAINTKAPIKGLNRLLDVVKGAPEDMKEQAMTGLKSSILEWASTKAGGSHSGTFSPSSLYDDMFRPMKGAKGRVSLVDWMKENKVMNEAELSNLRTYLSEMVRFEAAEQAGNIGELVDRAGPLFDFYLGITGSALGTRAQKIITGGQSGPGALIAAGQGAETMRRIFNDIPAALQTDVMSELMSNPKLLAAMMRKPRNDKERIRLASRVGDMLKNLGFSPLRRELPAVPREIDDEIEKETIVVPPSNQQGFMNTVPQVNPTRTATVTAPSFVPQNVSPALQASAQPSGPVDRTRYAAMFPNDSASALIKQGIGSMMG
jgi:hypothetical protein